MDLAKTELLTGALGRVLNDNVLVVLESRAEQMGYSGPLVIPDLAPRGTSEQLAAQAVIGRVLLVGPRAVGQVEPGDRVVVSQLCGDAVAIPGVQGDCRVVRVEAIVGVVEDEGIPAS